MVVAKKNVNFRKVHLHKLLYMSVQFVKKVSHLMLKHSNKIVFVVRNVICRVIMSVLALKMEATFPKNQVHGIVLTVLSFSRLPKKSIYIIIFLLLISKYLKSI